MTAAMERPPPRAAQSTLNADIKRVQELRARLAEQNGWRHNQLVLTIVFKDGTFQKLVFTSLQTFCPTARDSVWIVGKALKHGPNLKQGFYNIRSIVSDIAPLTTRQTHLN